MPNRNTNGKNNGEKPPVPAVYDYPNVVAVAHGYLERDGYRVSEAGDRLRALDLARKAQPCLVAPDLMLPGLDGLEVCRRLQAESMVPIIMLTGRVEEADRLEELNLGADDYITKPFSPRDLAARLRAVLCRSDRECAVSIYPERSFAAIRVNLPTGKATVDGGEFVSPPNANEPHTSSMREGYPLKGGE